MHEDIEVEKIKVGDVLTIKTSPSTEFLVLETRRYDTDIYIKYMRIDDLKVFSRHYGKDSIFHRLIHD